MTAPQSIKTEFRMQLEYVDQANSVVRQEDIKSADFDHAVRATAFDAFRHGLLAKYHPCVTGARVEPLFADDSSSSPRAKGFRVFIPVGGNGEHGCEFTSSYFSAAASCMRAELLRTGAMTPDQELYYRLHAFLDDAEPHQVSNKLAISLQPTSPHLPIAAGCRSDFGLAEPWDEPNERDMPVLFDEAVLDEAVVEARENPEREIAGFLLGHVRRDQVSKDVFVAVTGLVSAGASTQSSGTSVTFTPASFAHVRHINKLRASGESVVGWYHSHPFKLCAECPLPTPPACVAKILFFSADDIHLMETTFEQPFMVGLLAAVEPRIEEAVGHLPVKLYGWQGGEIKERGFQVIHAAECAAAAVPANQDEGEQQC